MTCIAAIAHDGVVYMGGDSAMTSDWDIDQSTQPKVFHHGRYLFGFTCSFRLGQILEHVFQPPKPPKLPRGSRAADLHAFMVGPFVNELRECLMSAGYAKSDCGREEGGELLVGVGGRLFHVTEDYSVTESAHRFDACGSGGQVALGSLYTTHGRADVHPRQRIRVALLAAESLDASVRGPFTVLARSAKP